MVEYLFIQFEYEMTLKDRFHVCEFKNDCFFSILNF